MKKETISNILSVAVSFGTAYVICDWLYKKGRKQGFSEGLEQGHNMGKLIGYVDCLKAAIDWTKPENEENESE